MDLTPHALVPIVLESTPPNPGPRYGIGHAASPIRARVPARLPRAEGGRAAGEPRLSVAKFGGPACGFPASRSFSARRRRVSCRERRCPSRWGAGRGAGSAAFRSTREFRDVVFEDVGFENDSLLALKN